MYVGKDAQPAALSIDGRVLATIAPGPVVALWELVSRKELKKLRDPVPWLGPLAFAPDGKTLVGGNVDGQLHFWNVASGNAIVTLPAHLSACRSISFAPDGRCLATAEAGDTIKLWPAPAFAETDHSSPMANHP
jgi:WD40 repeat protein